MTDWQQSDFTSWLARVHQAGAVQQWRYLVVLSGDRLWAHDLCAACPELLGNDNVWVSDRAPSGARVIEFKQVNSLLGRETGNIVFDAWSGFHPNAFAALAGTVRAGGVMLLLTPPFTDWPQLNDPDYRRMDVPGFGTTSKRRFLQYLGQCLRHDDRALRIEVDAPLPAPCHGVNVVEHDSGLAQQTAANDCVTAEQMEAVSAMEKVVFGHRKRPLVLCADRGRGKTAALGIACARLLQRGVSPILVTAPLVRNIEPLFERAAALLPEAQRHGMTLSWGSGSIHYLAPDHLLEQRPDARLLMVDEAAAIPTPLLSKMLDYYPRLVFTTTVHGYEGTGRGFALRFQAELSRRMPQWRYMTLLTPVRWAEGDALEASVNNLLLLQADALPDHRFQQAAEVTGVMTSSQRTVLLDRDQLSTDRDLLTQVFGLLMIAHYRTTPDDLRLMLDGPNIRVVVRYENGLVAAVILLACEGELEPAIASAIQQGVRRPRGHLLPQTLLAQTGSSDFLAAAGWRVVRIAVHPVLQHQGRGLDLLSWLAQRARACGVRYLGSSFGATAGLIRFWRRAGFHPVAIGSRRDAASGAYALVVLQPLSMAMEAIVDSERRRFAEALPLALGENLCDLEVEVVAMLLRAMPLCYPLVQRDYENVEAFARGCRSYHSCYPSLWKAALRLLIMATDDDALDCQQASLLITKLLQHDDWAHAANRHGLSGQGQLVSALRDVFAGDAWHIGDYPA